MINAFDADVAKDVGVIPAIIYFNISYWCEHNRTNDVNFYDGHYWTYNSTKAFCEQFPYLSKDQINYAIKKLEENGYIMTGNYNKSSYDRTKWFADLRGEKSIHSISEYSEMDLGNSRNGFGDSTKPIPNINTNNNQITNVKESKKKFDPIEILDSVGSIRTNEDVRNAFLDFLEMRKQIKHPVNTERALKLLINDAFKYGVTSNGVIAVINQSIKNGWRGIFALKTESSYNAPRTPQAPQKSVMEQLDDMLAECEGESEFGANTALLEA